MSYARALAVMAAGSFLAIAFFGGIAPGIQPVFDAVATNPAVESTSSPVSPTIISDIRFIVFIVGPLLLIFASILFPIIFAVRREVTLR